MIRLEKKVKLCLYRREYYEKNRCKIAEYLINEYWPQKIEQMRQKIPQKVEAYYNEYAYDLYLQNYTKFMLRKYGITLEKNFYQECFSNTFLGYMYAIGQCAYYGYSGEHVKNYIKLMIRISIISSIYVVDEIKLICQEQHFKVIYLDDDARTRR